MGRVLWTPIRPPGFPPVEAETLGAGRTVLLIFSIFVTVYLTLLLGPIGLLVGILLLSTALVFTRHRREQTRPWRPMRLRKFIGLLWLVALVAILYSPSALEIPVNRGGTGQGVPDALKAMSPFIEYLQSKYQVVITNSTQSLLEQVGKGGKTAFILIGPDEHMNLTREEARIIKGRYLNGTLSLLMAEGNSTNNSFLESLFHVRVKGDAIRDPTSVFTDDLVFTATAHIGSENLTGLFDVASPMILEDSASMWTIASSSSNSTEVSYDPGLRANKTLGPRTVAAASELNGSRAIVVSDSAPFSTAYNANFTGFGVDERAFAKAMVEWVTRSDENTTIILDNTHYNLPLVNVGGSGGIRLPIGRLFALGLAFMLSASNGIYSGFLSFSRLFFLGLALFTTWSVYGMLTSRFGSEKRGKDDEPLPGIERSVVAESREKMDFLKTTRTKGFYVASLEQLHDVLNDVMLNEFGASISVLQPEQLVQRLGDRQAKDATRLFSRLSKIAEYARGKRRFLLPPVLRWKRTTRKLTGQAERILNQLGLTIAGTREKKQVEYKLRRG